MRNLVTGGEDYIGSDMLNLLNLNGHDVTTIDDLHSPKKSSSIEEVTGKRVKVCYGPKQFGYPASLVADSSNIRNDWVWQPQYSSWRAYESCMAVGV